uniref:Uncharacterized protein n=1 Tax=Glossina brevipalpis TaxID=37001 RepID=A0A1A9WPI7_9MUSC
MFVSSVHIITNFNHILVTLKIYSSKTSITLKVHCIFIYLCILMLLFIGVVKSGGRLTGDFSIIKERERISEDLNNRIGSGSNYICLERHCILERNHSDRARAGNSRDDSTRDVVFTLMIQTKRLKSDYFVWFSKR